TAWKAFVQVHVTAACAAGTRTQSPRSRGSSITHRRIVQSSLGPASTTQGGKTLRPGPVGPRDLPGPCRMIGPPARERVVEVAERVGHVLVRMGRHGPRVALRRAV